jgi:hypothetical protein
MLKLREPLFNVVPETLDEILTDSKTDVVYLSGDEASESWVVEGVGDVSRHAVVTE